MFCPKCGNVVADNETFCPACGTTFGQQQVPVTPAYGGAPVYGGAPAGGYTPAPTRNPGNGLGIASMVLGIISLVLFCWVYVSIPCALVGVILGGVGMKKSKDAGMTAGMATAGLVCSIVSLAVVALIYISGAAFLADLGLL